MAQTIAATITKANGSVNVIRDGKTIELNKGDSVFATDTIETENSSVELTFADGAISILSPKTTMTVQEFSMDMESPSFVLNLAQGAMRSISGEVVDKNPDAFKVTTPKATVGIRGTDWVLTINPDGSQTIAVLSLSQGHNVTVTGHNGQVISLGTANQGATIGADSDGTITPYNFSPQEVQDLVQQIVGALTAVNEDGESEDEVGEGEESGEGEDDSDGDSDGEEVENEDSNLSVELDQGLLDTLSTESVDSLVTALEDAGVDVIGLGEDLTNDLDSLDLGDDDEIGEIVDNSVYENGLLVVSADGSDHFYADSSLTGSVAVNHYLKIEGDGTGPYTYSGDVSSHSSGTLTAGGDRIEAQDMSNGRVVGDAETVAGGTFTGGSDTISIASKTGGNSVYGDVANVEGGTVSFGNDNITITGALNSTVAGDALDIYASATIKAWGNDTISVGSMSSDAKVYGDAVTSAVSGGGNDSITVGSMAGGNVYGGDGNDTIAVGSMTSGYLDGGAGNDSIVVGDISAGGVEGGTGKDTIEVGNIGQNVSVYAGDADGAGENIGNKITATGMTGNASITGDDGDDTIEVGTLNGDNNDGTYAIINGVGGDDSIKVTSLMAGRVSDNGGDNTITITNMSGGAVYLGDGADEITIETYTGGTIDGGAGVDALTIKSFSGSLDLSTAKVETYNLSGLSTSGTLTLGDVTSGTINTTGGTVSVTGNLDELTIKNTGAADTFLTLGGGVDANSIVTLEGSRSIDAAASNLRVGTFDNKIVYNSANDSTAFVAGTVTENAELMTSATHGVFFSAATVSGNASITGGSGADKILVRDTLTGSATLNGGAGQDTIQVSETTMSGGIINAGTENDTITIETSTFSAGTINGDAGNDTITIDRMDDDGFGGLKNTVMSGTATINGGAGDDIISIGGLDNDGSVFARMEGGSINGGDGDDSIYVGNLSGGVIDGGGDASQDKLYVTSLTASGVEFKNFKEVWITNDIGSFTYKATDDVGTVYIGGKAQGKQIEVENLADGDDALLGGDGADTITVTAEMSGSSISGGAEVDVIDIATMSGGSVDAGDGADSIDIATMSGGSVNGGGTAGEDTLNITDSLTGISGADSIKMFTNLAELNITSLSGVDAWDVVARVDNVDKIFIAGQRYVASLSDGDGLNGTASADTINIASMSGGVVNGSNGNDTFNIASWTGGIIDDGEGSYDVVNILNHSSTINMSGSRGIEAYNFNTLAGGTIIVGNSQTVNILDIDGSGFVNISSTDVTLNIGSASLADGETLTVSGTDELKDSAAIMGALAAGTVVNASSVQHTITNLSGIGVYQADSDGAKLAVTTMSGGSVEGGAGADSITITGTMSGGSVEGGAGADSISIGSMSGGTVDGGGDAGQDTLNITGSLTAISGDDSIKMFSNLAELHIADLADGIDAQDVVARTQNVGKIYIENAQYIDSLSSGTLNGTADPDTMHINSISGSAIINAGAGADILNIANMSGGIINTGYPSGHADIGSDNSIDVVTIGTISGGTINGSAGGDSITINHAITEGTIEITNHFSGQANLIDVNFAGGISGGTVTLSGMGGFNLAVEAVTLVGQTNISGTGRLNISSAADEYKLGTLSGGIIDVTNGSSSLVLSSLTSGSIYSNGGRITINSPTLTGTANIFNNTNLAVDLVMPYAISGAGQQLNLTGNNGSGFRVAGGISTGSAPDYALTVTHGIAISDGITVNGSAHADEFHMWSMSNGTINAGGGDDSIVLTYTGSNDGGSTNVTGTMSDGSINMGDGNDSVTITTMSGGTVDGGGDAGQDTLSIGTLTYKTADASDKMFSNLASLEIDSLGSGITAEEVIARTENVGEVRIDDTLYKTTLGSGGVLEATADVSNINVTGSMTGGTITGNDSSNNITVKTMTGSTAVINAGGADDTIIITDKLQNSATINAGAGNDNIQINSILQSTIDGGEGTDTLTINTVVNTSYPTTINNMEKVFLTAGSSNANMSINAGSDVGVTLAASVDETGLIYTGFAMSGGTINTSADADTIYIGEMSDGTINSGAGADIINIDTMSGGTVNGGVSTSEDIVTIGNLTVITADASEKMFSNLAELHITDLDDGIGVQDVIDRTLNVGKVYIKGALYANVNGLSEGTLEGSANADAITVTGDMTGGTINALAGADIVTITGKTTNNATINTAEGDDSISVATVEGGTIDGGADTDTFTLENQFNDDARYTTISNMENVFLKNGASGEGSLYINKNSNVSVTVAKSYDSDTGTYAGFDISNKAIIDTSNVADNIYIGKLEASTPNSGTNINSGAGEDNIYIDTSIRGNINGGADSDTLTIKNVYHVTGSYITSVSNMENVFLKSGMTAGTFEINKNTNVGVTLAASYDAANSAAPYTGFDLGSGSNYSIIRTGNDVDTIYIDEMSGANTSIDTNAGNDVINITSMSDGKVYGGDGDDFIDITSLGGGLIDGEEGSDELSIGTLTGHATFKNIEVVRITNELADGVTYSTENVGELYINNILHIKQERLNYSDDPINGTENADNITITGYEFSGTWYGGMNGTINGDAGNDTITILHGMDNGTINGGAGEDSITIDATWFRGTIDGGDGIDTLNIDELSGGNNVNTVSNMENVFFAGITGDEGGKLDINVGTDVGVTLAKSYDADTDTYTGFDISMSPSYGSAINTGDGVDNLHINNVLVANISTNGGDDNINITGTLSNSSSIDSGAGADSIKIHTINEDSSYSRKSVLGGDGNDTIEVNTLTEAGFDGGADSDTFILNTALAGTGNLYNMENVFLEAGMTSGSRIEINKDSSVAVTLAKSYDEANDTYASFDMAGGGIYTGNDADTIYIGTMSGSIYAYDGNDTINITEYKGSVSVGFINAGDGDDVINIGKWTGGEIHSGDGSSDGYDVINVTGDVDYALTLYSTGVEAHNITKLADGGSITTYENSQGISILDIAGSSTINLLHDYTTLSLSGLDDADTLTISGVYNLKDNAAIVNELSAGTIINASTRTHTIGTLSGTGVYQADADEASYLDVTTMSGGTVAGGVGNDYITISSVTGSGTISNSGGEDRITINNFADGVTITTEGAGDFDFTVKNGSMTELAQGTIQHNGTGTLTLAGLGNDTNATDGTGILRTGDQGGTLNLTGSLTSGQVLGGAGNDTITVNSFIFNNGHADTKIDAGAGDDVITINSSTKTENKIFGGDGNDTITISDMNDGTINAGAGSNVIDVTLNDTGIDTDVTINITDGSDSIYLRHEDGAMQSLTIDGFDIASDKLYLKGSTTAVDLSGLSIDAYGSALLDGTGAGNGFHITFTNMVTTPYTVISGNYGEVQDAVADTTYKNNNFLVNVLLLENLFGDAINNTVDNVTGGNDRLTLAGDCAPGVVAGDIMNSSGNNFVGGNDTININGNITDGSIISGDVCELTGGSFTGGNDTINIIGNITGEVTISGDITMHNGGTATYGQDVINITGIVGNADGDIINIYGDYNGTDDTVGANDSITINGNITNANIKGQGGDDTITINLSSRDGMSGTVNITGDAGDDVINLGYQGGSELLELPAGVTIDGGEGSDTLRLTNAVTTSIDLSNLGDSLGDATITGFESYAFVGLGVNGTITGSDVTGDNIIVESMTGGKIEGKAGADNISVEVNYTGAKDNSPIILLGEDNDTLTLTVSSANGNSINVGDFTEGDTLVFGGKTYLKTDLEALDGVSYDGVLKGETTLTSEISSDQITIYFAD